MTSAEVTIICPEIWMLWVLEDVSCHTGGDCYLVGGIFEGITLLRVIDRGESESWLFHP